VNQARDDGLLLSHWHKKTEPLGATTPNASNTSDINGIADANVQATTPAETKEDAQMVEDGEYKFAKYNLQIQIPRYEASLYDQYLQNPDWSREETEYLIDLHKEYYGKWPLIVDRYDFKPVTAHNVELGADPATQAAPIHRSMEDLKHRFYTVCSLLMAAHTPLTNMTSAEFELHEKYGKFDPKRETERKRHKELIMTRSDEDKKEEEHLLAELRRIYLRQKRNEEERAELRDRLDHSITDPAADATLYKTSAEINALFHKMMAKDKSAKQRRTTMDGGMAGSPANMHGAGHTPGSASVAKRGSIAVAPGQSTPGAGRKQLTPREEVRFGVTHHDRLTSGVTFRSDKIAKVRQAKSQVQTQKIAAILAELQVPDMFQMPSSAVVSGMEKLVQKVGLLIEARKVKEKEENDLKVARERKKMRESELGPRPADGGVQGADVDMSNAQDAAVEEIEGETKVEGDEEEEEEAEEEQEGEDEDEDDDEGAQQVEEDGEAEDDDDEDEEDEDGQETFADAAETFGDDQDEREERQDSEEAAEEAADRSGGEEEEEDEEEEEEPQTVRRGNKRSASVLSVGSSAVTAKRMKAG